MNRVRPTLICFAAVCALALPAAAQASYQDVIRDCAKDGRLDGNYSNEEKRKAAKNLPADLDEYSDCREVINAAITSNDTSGGPGGAGASGIGGPGAGPGGGFSPRPGDRAALDRLRSSKEAPELSVGGRTVRPGSNGLFDLATASNGLPLPLLLALAALALLAAGAGAFVLRRRFPSLANVSFPRIGLPFRLPRVRLPFRRG